MHVTLIAVVAVLAAASLLLARAFLKARKDCREYKQELERLREEINSQEAALGSMQQRDAIKDEFISTVSHELRTPLTSIRGALGLLSGGMIGQIDEKASNLLRIASTNTDRLVRLINDILDLERMDSGRAPMHLRACSLRELVLQSVDTMTAMAEDAGVLLVIAPDPQGMPPAFLGDPDRIQQVLMNLLSNAIKFSPRDSAIVLRTSFDREAILLRIEDAGRGIPQSKLESIFDRFTQIEAADARQKGGTGLGLAICRTILTQHNGRVWAMRNDADGSGRPGTTFVIRLPRSRDVEQAAGAGTGLPVTSGTVLIVDDDDAIRHVVAQQLKQHGYTAIETSSGEEALAIANSQRIDAILLDLHMPGLSGSETLQRLKRDAETNDIPVVVLSVLSPTARNAAIAADAQGWVQKPFNERILLAELGRVIQEGGQTGHVLLVEDDRELAALVRSSFDDLPSDSGVTLQHVESLADAQHACTETPPDLIILDLTLPDGSGFAFVQWLRGQPGFAALPLVVYSGRDVTAAEKEQLRLGPTQFLEKARVQPSDVEDLVQAMLRHLRPAS